MSEKIHDVIVIGSGPAGYTAALYLARANIIPLILEGPVPGGQLTTTTDVENYPGFPEGILGPDLMQSMKEQAERFGSETMNATALELLNDTSPFELKVEDYMAREQILKAKSLVIATGASARYLGMDKEQELLGFGVSACATCDGAFYRDKHVAVVGGGDSAMEEAIFLTRFASKVTIIHRREGFRAEPITIDKAKANPKIEWALNKTVEEIHGTQKTRLQSVTLKDTQTGELSEMPLDGLFLAIGHIPNTGFLKGKLNVDEAGFIITPSDTTATNIPGIFACGDVADPTYRQAVLAAGRGCMAAIDSKNFLED